MQKGNAKCIIKEFARIWAYIILSVAYLAGVGYLMSMACDVMDTLNWPVWLNVVGTITPFVFALFFLVAGLVSDSMKETYANFWQGIKILLVGCLMVAAIIGLMASIGYLGSFLPDWSALALVGILVLGGTIIYAAEKCGYIK